MLSISVVWPLQNLPPPRSCRWREKFFVLFFFTDGRDLRIFISEKVSCKIDSEDTGIEEIIVGTRFWESRWAVGGSLENWGRNHFLHWDGFEHRQAGLIVCCCMWGVLTYEVVPLDISYFLCTTGAESWAGWWRREEQGTSGQWCRSNIAGVRLSVGVQCRLGVEARSD